MTRRPIFALLGLMLGGFLVPAHAQTQPPNNAFANATVISAVPFSDSTVTTLATIEPGEPTTCGGIGRTVWYRYISTADVYLTADTFGSDFDTVLGAYATDTLPPTFFLACNDDTGGLQSKVVVLARTGSSIYFQAGGYFGDSGNLVFHLDAALPFQPPVFITPPTPCNDSVTGTVGSLLTFDVAASAPSPGDTVTLSVQNLPGGVLPIPPPAGSVSSTFTWTTQIADVGPHPITITASNSQGFQAICPVILKIITGAEGPPGDPTCFDLLDNDANGYMDMLDPGCSPTPSNNDLANATPVTTIPSVFNQNTMGGTSEPGEPAPCDEIGGTVWYSFTPVVDTPIVISTAGSDFNTILAAYVGNSIPTLTEIACNHYAGGYYSELSFTAQAGETVYVQAGGYFNMRGNLRLSFASGLEGPVGSPSCHDAIDNDHDGSTDFRDTACHDPLTLPLPRPCGGPVTGAPPGWSSRAPIPEPRRGASAVLMGDRIYVTHGANGTFPVETTNFIYDIPSDVWYLGSPASAARSDAVGVCAEVGGQGRVFVLGGEVPGSPPVLNLMEMYDPATDNWTPQPPMPTVRSGFAAVWVPATNTIYALGGRTSTFPNYYSLLNANEAFDVNTGTWSAKAPLPILLTDLSAAWSSVTGKLYVIGGFDGLNDSNRVFIYDPSTDTWSEGSSMPTPRSDLLAAHCGTHISAIGGYRRFQGPLITNEAFDPVTAQWIGGQPPLPAAASDAAAAAVSTDSDVFVIGSGDFSLGTTLNQVFTCVATTCQSDADCGDEDFCNGSETCRLGRCAPGPPPSCDDANVCTDNLCHPVTGCQFPNNVVQCDDGDACTVNDVCSSGTCTPGADVCCIEPDPKPAGYFRLLCQGYNPPDQLSQADIDCVNDSCTFALVDSVTDICAILIPPRSNNDVCAEAKSQLMALELNLCRKHVCTGTQIDSLCTTHVRVSESEAEADAFLCSYGAPYAPFPPSSGPPACFAARCECFEINVGLALRMDGLRLDRPQPGTVRLSWAPFIVSGSPPPIGYKVWRRPQGDPSFTLLAATPGLAFDDVDVELAGSFEYQVTPEFP